VTINLPSASTTPQIDSTATRNIQPVDPVYQLQPARPAHCAWRWMSLGFTQGSAA